MKTEKVTTLKLQSCKKMREGCFRIFLNRWITREKKKKNIHDVENINVLHDSSKLFSWSDKE